MVDFLSRYRLYGLGYTAPELRKGHHSYRELYRETSPFIFNRRPKVHDCRGECMKAHAEKSDYDAMMMSYGLQETYRSVDMLRNKEKELTSTGTKAPDKLLYNLGEKGSQDGDFDFPRGLATTLDGEVIVADTMNHRVQIFNQQGLFVKTFGRKGSEEGEFNEPTGVTELPNGDIAVADNKNKRVQVFARSRRKFKFSFQTGSRPFAITSDKNYTMVVSTMDGFIEVYSRAGKIRHRFAVNAKTRGAWGLPIALNDKEEVVVADTPNRMIKYYTYEGRLLYEFKPVADGNGLAMMPSAVCLTPLGDVVVCDALNHAANVYSERGVLLRPLVGPSDGAGKIQACAIGPEGHFIATEFSLSGPHSMKVFRYLQCYCHLTRPGSSKRRSPTPTAKKVGETTNDDSKIAA